MKTFLALITIIILSLLFVDMTEAQENNTKVQIDPEFEKFWIEFQKDIKKLNPNKIKLYTNNVVIQITNGGTIIEFCKIKCIEKKELASLSKVNINEIVESIEITNLFVPERKEECNKTHGLDQRKLIHTKAILELAKINVESRFFTVPIRANSSFYAATFAKVNGKHKIIAMFECFE